jgi:LysR family transcriptional regulator, hydrogen peroxide-inducible genes activator
VVNERRPVEPGTWSASCFSNGLPCPSVGSIAFQELIYDTYRMSLTPLPITLRQLQYIVAVADARSFNGAAKRCGVSQPSLSMQLAEAEQQLGVALFERSRKHVLVTAAGEALLPRAKAILREVDELILGAEHAQDPMNATLRIGIIPTLSPYLLPAIAPALHKRYGSLRIVWAEEKTVTLLDMLRVGALDGALLAMVPGIGDLEQALIAEDPFLLVAPPHHALATKKGPVRESELLQQELLLLGDGHCFREHALEACSTSKIREGEFRATSLSTLVQMVAAGDGVTLIPEIAASTELARAQLVSRRAARQQAYNRVGVAASNSLAARACRRCQGCKRGLPA